MSNSGIDAVSTTTLVGQRKVLEAEVRKTGVRKTFAAARGWKGEFKPYEF